MAFRRPWLCKGAGLDPLAGQPFFGFFAASRQVTRRFGEHGHIEISGARIRVHEDRDGVFEQDHIGRGDEGEGRGEDQVTGLDAGSAHAQVQPGRARVDANGMICSGIVAETFFEGTDLRPHAEVGTLEHLDDRLDIAIRQAGLLQGERTPARSLSARSGGTSLFFLRGEWLR